MYVLLLLFIKKHKNIMVYGLTSYIREYFTREYFNTTAPSDCEFKNVNNTKIAIPRNINPAKIKAHTVYILQMHYFEDHQMLSYLHRN